tara:strand:- start:2447 stop:2605 length:159 start_codon:yes stop_codon:yes gene_type:complete
MVVQLVTGKLCVDDLKNECYRRELVCSDEPMEMLEAILEDSGLAHLIWLREA